MAKRIAWILFLAAVAIYSIKAGYFALWHDEMSTASAANLAHALDLARKDVVPPFFFVVNALFKAVFGNSVYFQKLPHILMGALWVVLFYHILNHFQFKRPLLLTLLVATSFILIFFAQDIHPYSYYILLSLVSLFYGYKIFIEEKGGFADFAWLALAFLILPMNHYFAFFHILILDIALLVFILFSSRGKKLIKIGQLILLNTFIFVGLAPWADYFRNLFLGGGLGSAPGETLIYHFDIKMLRNVLYKFTGGSDVWSLTVFVAFVVVTVWQVRSILRKRAKKESLTEGERFAAYLVVYLLIFTLIVPTFPFKRFLFWRYFIFLIWPFWLLLAAGYSQVISSSKKAVAIAANLLLGLFIVSSIVDSGAYLLAPHRFSDWRELANKVEQITKQQNKKRVILNNLGNPGDLMFYLKDSSLKIEPLSGGSVNVSEPDNLSNNIACCLNDIVYIHVEDPVKMSKLMSVQEGSRAIRERADGGFKNKIVLWDNPFSNFLTSRKVSPFWDYYIEQGGYFKPVIYF